MNELILKEAGKDDIRRLWEFCSRLTREEFAIWGADMVYDYPPDLSQMTKSLETRKNMKLFRIETDGRIIGFGELDGIGEEGPCATLSRLFIAPEFRGKGRGKEAVKKFLEEAFELKEPLVEGVKLIVYQKNVRAKHCYEACGFQVTEPLIREEKPDAWVMWAMKNGGAIYKNRKL